MPPGRSVGSLLVSLALAFACGGKDAELDGNKDLVADDLGKTIDKDGDDRADGIDINGDGTIDGFGIDTDGDGDVDALALDTDCDGLFDARDDTGDGLPDFITSRETPENNPSCKLPDINGSGGSMGTGGSSPMAGTGTGGAAMPSELGKGTYQGTGVSTDQYAEDDVYRNGVGYMFIANGWGMNWGSHELSWNGTSFTVLSLSGTQGSDYSPAGYPTVFCGFYSNKQSVGNCGLPAAITSLASVKTGWRWKANGNTGQYNAAWDIWLGNGTSFSSYLMVWLRDPPGQQPAGANATAGATVPGLPGSWNVWTGQVNGSPIVNYVLAEGSDLSELEFDVMDVLRHAGERNYTLPGTHILSVAVGFEVWNGPVSNLVSEDFYVDVKLK
jgi:hypothetical protein